MFFGIFKNVSPSPTPSAVAVAPAIPTVTQRVVIYEYQPPKISVLPCPSFNTSTNASANASIATEAFDRTTVHGWTQHMMFAAMVVLLLLICVGAYLVLLRRASANAYRHFESEVKNLASLNEQKQDLTAKLAVAMAKIRRAKDLSRGKDNEIKILKTNVKALDGSVEFLRGRNAELQKTVNRIGLMKIGWDGLQSRAEKAFLRVEALEPENEDLMAQLKESKDMAVKYQQMLIEQSEQAKDSAPQIAALEAKLKASETAKADMQKRNEDLAFQLEVQKSECMMYNRKSANMKASWEKAESERMDLAEELELSKTVNTALEVQNKDLADELKMKDGRYESLLKIASDKILAEYYETMRAVSELQKEKKLRQEAEVNLDLFKTAGVTVADIAMDAEDAQKVAQAEKRRSERKEAADVKACTEIMNQVFMSMIPERAPRDDPCDACAAWKPEDGKVPECEYLQKLQQKHFCRELELLIFRAALDASEQSHYTEAIREDAAALLKVLEKEAKEPFSKQDEKWMAGHYAKLMEEHGGCYNKFIHFMK